MINLILICIFSYFLASQRSSIGIHPNPCLCDVFPNKFAKTIAESLWVIQSRWHNWMWRPGESNIIFFLNSITFYLKIKICKVLSLLEACFDLISGSWIDMKIQIMGGKIQIPTPDGQKSFLSFFFLFANSPKKICISLF